MSSFKELNISNPGTSTKYGGNDTDLINKLFNGTVAGIPPVRIRSQNKFGFDDGIMWIYNQALSKRTTIRGQSNAPATDVDLSLPPITGNDVLSALNLEQAWLKKQQFNLGMSMQEMDVPTTPGASYHHLFYGTDGHLYGKNAAGSLVDYDSIIANATPSQYGAKIIVIQEGAFWKAIKSDGTTLSSSATPQTVLQAALNGLTVSRTWKERVKLFGYPTVSQLILPSYTTFDMYDGGLFSANASNTNLLINSDGVGGNTDIEIMGGTLDGNRANNAEDNGAVTPPLGQYGSRSTIHLNKVANASVHDLTSKNSNSCDVYVYGASQNISVHHCTLIGAEKSAIFFDGTSLPLGTAKYLYAHHNYIAGLDENPVASYGPTDIWIEYNKCIGPTITSGINCNGARMHINHNYLKDMLTTGLSIGIEGTFSSDDSEVCFNYVDGACSSASPASGLSIGASAPCDRLIIIGNKVKAAAILGFVTALGLRVSATENSIIANNMAWNWGRNGIFVSGSNTTFAPDGRLFDTKNVIIADNITWDNGKDTASTTFSRAGIAVINTLTSSYIANMIKNFNIHGNRSFDNGSGTQLYGMYVQSTDDSWVHHNDLRGNITSALGLLNNVNLVVENNKGYVTENMGHFQANGDGTTKAFNIAHGLAATPTSLVAEAGSDDSIGPFKRTVTSTNIVVTFPTAPPVGTNNVDIWWRAWC